MGPVPIELMSERRNCLEGLRKGPGQGVTRPYKAAQKNLVSIPRSLRRPYMAFYKASQKGLECQECFFKAPKRDYADRPFICSPGPTFERPLDLQGKPNLSILSIEFSQSLKLETLEKTKPNLSIKSHTRPCKTLWGLIWGLLGLYEASIKILD